MSEASGTDERVRYARQLILPGVGEAGQRRLASARVLVIGLGGLGCPASTYLAAAGVGRIGLCDFDTVELSNLHRQVLHGVADIGRPKTQSAVERLRSLNPEVDLVVHNEGIGPANALGILAGYDLVVDGSDNFACRYLVNDAAFLAGKPLVYGSLFQFEGQVTVLGGSGESPCYRCLFPDMPAPDEVPNCAEAGVFGALCGLVGSWQALEATKLVLGIGTPLQGRLMRVNALSGRVSTIALKRDPECPLCGTKPSIRTLDPSRYVFRCKADMESGNEVAVEVNCGQARIISEAIWLDVREDWEVETAFIPGARHIPLGELRDRWNELPRDRNLVVYCHHGMRSLNATRLLRSLGLSRATSLRGGIDAWSREVDPSIPRY